MTTAWEKLPVADFFLRLGGLLFAFMIITPVSTARLDERQAIE
jgi:hypothetical protein